MILCELCNQHSAFLPSLHVWLIRSPHSAKRPVTLDFRVTDKHLLLFLNILTVQKQTQSQYTYKYDKHITLQQLIDVLSLYALLMPTVGIWLAKGTGWLGINLKSDPAVLLNNTVLWPAVKKSPCWKKPTFAII